MLWVEEADHESEGGCQEGGQKVIAPSMLTVVRRMNGTSCILYVFWNSTSLVSDNEKSMSYGNKVNMSDGGSDCAITRTLSGLGILTRGSENTETI